MPDREKACGATSSRRHGTGITRPSKSSRPPPLIAQLAEIRPDIAFIGTNGVSGDFGLSTPDELEAQVKQAMVGRARLAVVLVDSSKHDDEALQRFAALDEVDVLITDAPPGPALAVALDEAEVEVRVA